VSDEQVFAAVARAMARVGPRELSLAVIAAEAGLTPGALVQRFGSKRELLARLAEHSAAGAADLLERLRAEHESPLEALQAYAECIGELATTPAALARNLAYLQTDLADDHLRSLLKRQAQITRKAVMALVRGAVARSELAPETPVASLARTIEHVLAGALLTWAIYQEGSARRWTRAALDAVLAAYGVNA
jgi:AcrR family transcriptional regulator